MNDPGFVDGMLVQWGDRLFYPGNRRVPASPGRASPGLRDRAAVIRQRIERTVARAPQVMVKVTGGGRGMVAIAAHLRYISKNGRIPMEDDRGTQREGKEAMLDVADQWRLGGSRIPEKSERREAFNIMLSMPRGTDPLIVQRAARDFAQAELADHRYVMVLQDHQANPHVHLISRSLGPHQGCLGGVGRAGGSPADECGEPAHQRHAVGDRVDASLEGGTAAGVVGSAGCKESQRRSLAPGA